MSREEELEQLKKFKHLKATERVPADLAVAINTFIEQAVITGEYQLDTMPPEYVNNLINALTKYPEFDFLTRELLEILNKEVKPYL
jgi:hypothetical protein|tara:strand:- start:53 stop:310 length:258 start_codon:yes stop_codon:yes gene_type:complete